MEAFLSTLPPYVHEFLDKHPPTDVFNLLRELICFAVLYSQDRERINQATEEFLKKRQDQEDQIVKEVHHQEEEELEHEAVVPGIMDAIKEEEHETEPIVAEKPKLPNTFPEWWGHREFEPPKKQEKKPAEASVEHATVVHSNTTSATSTPVTTPPPPQQQSHATTWISWDNNTPAQQDDNDHYHFRLERARSQIIPDLRNYDEDKASHSRGTTNPKRHSMNIKNSTSPLVRSNTSTPRSTKTASPPPTVKKTTRRLSAAVCDSPVSTTQKPVNSPPTRSASLALKSPRPNAAMRARAEHAKQQQEELERKKNTPPPGSSMSLKLKQRVNSGIDWDTIKKERRKTVAEQPNSQKK